MIGGAHVLKSSRPSAAWISHSPVFHVPGRDSRFGHRRAEMSCIREIVSGAPVAAMNEEHRRMRSLARRKADLYELVRIRTVADARVSFGRLSGQDGLAPHSGQYKRARA